MSLKVSREVMAAMERAAKAVHPEEACGILLTEDGLICRLDETRNVHPSPKTHFEIDPQALINAHKAQRAGGMQIAGYFHSHPSGKAEPSATDRAMAARDGMIWAIVAGDTTAFWQDGKGGFVPLSYHVGSR